MRTDLKTLEWEVVDPDRLVDDVFERLPLGLRPRLGVKPTVKEFELAGLVLLRDLDRLRWQLGDWAVLLANSHGQQAYESLAAYLMSDRMARTVEDWAYICRNVPYSIRQIELSMSHHRAVAPLGDTQAYWLGEAIREGWSVRQLREAVAREEGKEPPPRIEDRIFEYEQANATLHRQVDNLVHERDSALKRTYHLEKRVNRLERACGLLRKALEGVDAAWSGINLIQEALKLLEGDE